MLTFSRTSSLTLLSSLRYKFAGYAYKIVPVSDADCQPTIIGISRDELCFMHVLLVSIEITFVAFFFVDHLSYNLNQNNARKKN